MTIKYLKQFNLPLDIKIKELEEITDIVNEHNNKITFEVNGDTKQIKCTYIGNIDYSNNFINK